MPKGQPRHLGRKPRSKRLLTKYHCLSVYAVHGLFFALSGNIFGFNYDTLNKSPVSGAKYLTNLGNLEETSKFILGVHQSNP